MHYRFFPLRVRKPLKAFEHAYKTQQKPNMYVAIGYGGQGEFIMMWDFVEREEFHDLYLAGERVMPGLYRQVNGKREVWLEQEDVLPASLDGRVACYRRVYSWALIQQQRPVEETSSDHSLTAP
ncbi:hypothetical protein CP488_01380 [Chthonomonas calidirosea]|nr:hypothetical protein CP488_01380 [Chthonomonas calidirosea]